MKEPGNRGLGEESGLASTGLASVLQVLLMQTVSAGWGTVCEQWLGLQEMPPPGTSPSWGP